MWRFLLLLVCALTLTLGSVRATTDRSDGSALNIWYAAIGSPAQLKGWSANGGDPCGESWRGITCSGTSVTEIILPSAGLSGQIGYNLNSFKSLVILDLSNNNFSGDINYNLPLNCEQINLSGNKFTGRVPSAISQMLSLKYLNLAHNQLQAPLDDMFGNLSNLAALDLSFNNLYGNLPSTFASLRSLNTLYLQNNRFTGSINVLAYLPLKTLHVAHNRFTGWIPAQLKNINTIQIDGNSWNTGPAPPPPSSPYTPPPPLPPPPPGSSNLNPDGNNNPNGGGKKSGGKMIGLITGIPAAAVCVMLIIACILYSYRRCNFRRYESLTTAKKLEKFLSEYKSLTATRYTYNEIKTMTNKFEHKLGQGAYGSVFKGKLPNGHLVAVKLMEKSHNDGEEFINEVATIGRIHHVNVVHLVGFCVEGSKRALVYEFMANGSLDKHIQMNEATGHSHLAWEKVQSIAVATARGIEYLHQGCDQRIIHFDIKPHNILLDEDFTPKISDFGLAKLHCKERSLVSITQGKGTIGYVAPEVFYGNFTHVSHKSDVYSFGMLLIAMVGMKDKANSSGSNTSDAYFPQCIYNRLCDERELEVAIGVGEEIRRKMTIIALWCIQWHPVDRPSIKEVLSMFESDAVDLEMPPNRFFPAAQSDCTSMDFTSSTFTD